MIGDFFRSFTGKSSQNEKQKDVVEQEDAMDTDVTCTGQTRYASKGHMDREQQYGGFTSETRTVQEHHKPVVNGAGPSKLRGGIYKPVNTLNRSELVRPQRHHEQTAKQRLVDGDTAVEQPAAKRRRVDSSTSDSNSMPWATHSNRNMSTTLPMRSTQSTQSSYGARSIGKKRSGSDSVFPTVLSNVEGIGFKEPELKRRDHRSRHSAYDNRTVHGSVSDGRASTQSLDGDVIESSQPAVTGSGVVSNHLVDPLEVSSPTGRHTRRASNIEHMRQATRTQIPPIHLDKGLDEITESSMTEMTRRAALSKARSKAEGTASGHFRHPAQFTNTSKRQPFVTNHQHNDGNNVARSSSSEPQATAKSTKLGVIARHHFQRVQHTDVLEAEPSTKTNAHRPKTRLKVADRMSTQFVTNSPREPVDQSSADELAQAPAISSKHKARASRHTGADNFSLPSSHIKPTNFTSQTRQSEKNSSSEATSRYFERPQFQRGSDTIAKHQSSPPSSIRASTPLSDRPRHLNVLDEPRRRSGRSNRAIAPVPEPEAEPEKWSKINKLKPWHRAVVYPENGARRATVMSQDLERLDEGEFLNDSIIGYALRRIEELTDHRDQIHFFNSFFYTAMSSGSRGINFDAVKKWTKGKDILDKPYIVVPINHDLHWFTAIICNLPKLLGRDIVDLDDGPSSLAPMADEVQDSQTTKDFERSQSSQERADQRIETTERMKSLSIDEDVVLSPRPKKKGKRHSVPIKRIHPDTPAVIILDSLGLPRAKELSNLKEYIVAEAQDKMKSCVLLNKADLQGMNAKGLPEQTNYCDCGVYLIAYLEAFARDPRTFVKRLLQKEMSPLIDFPDFDPSAKRAEIRNQLLALHEAQVTHRKETKQLANTDVNAQREVREPPPEVPGGVEDIKVPVQDHEAQRHQLREQDQEVELEQEPPRALNDIKSHKDTTSDENNEPQDHKTSVRSTAADDFCAPKQSPDRSESVLDHGTAAVARSRLKQPTTASERLASRKGVTGQHRTRDVPISPEPVAEDVVIEID